MSSELETLVRNFDLHFRWNEKKPHESKIIAWFELETATWLRFMQRKGLKAIQARIKERWPETK